MNKGEEKRTWANRPSSEGKRLTAASKNSLNLTPVILI